MAQHPVQLNLKSVSSVGEPTTSLGRLAYEWLIVLIVENFPLVSSWDLPRSNLYPLPLVFSMWLLVERGPHLLCRRSLSTGTWDKVSPLRLLFSRLNKPNSLSLSSYDRLPSPLVIFVALHWIPSSLSASFWYSRGGLTSTILMITALLLAN